MNNPYLDIFLNKSLGQNPVDILDILGKDGDKSNLESYFNLFNYRLILTRKYAWAIPDAVSIQLIKEFSPLIEIGAGIGYWANLVSESGGDILAFDNEESYETLRISGDLEKISQQTNVKLDLSHRWFEVKVGGVEQVKLNPDRTLFLCWPPFKDEMALQCVKNYTGKYFIFVGEDASASNNHSFDEYIQNHFKKIIDHPIPTYEGISDSLNVFERL
ncbi:MAG: hypothetical protein KC493_13885 [Bacteriovoracaceae bacterium]|nr:hypothetical protein [Bacteriovoracaceae bacterium]